MRAISVKKTKNNYLTFFLSAIFFLIPFSLQINNIFIVISLLLSIYYFDSKMFFVNWNKNKKLIISMLFVFFILFIDVFNGTSSQTIITILIRNTPFLIFPFVFIGNKITFENQKKIINFFIIGNTLLIGIIEVNFLITIFNSTQQIIDLIFKNSNFDLLSLLDLHPTYLSLSIFFSSILLYKQYTSSRKYVFLVLILVHYLFIFHLMSRVVIITYPFMFLVMLINKDYKILFLHIIISFFVATVFFSKKNENKLQIERFKQIRFDNLDLRFKRLIVSYEIFIENPVSGVGKDKIQSERIKKYLKYHFFSAAKNTLNSHNQYFEFLSIYGFLAFLAYINLLYQFIYDALIKKRKYFLLILVGFLLVSFTESILQRSMGVILMGGFLYLYLITETWER